MDCTTLQKDQLILLHLFQHQTKAFQAQLANLTVQVSGCPYSVRLVLFDLFPSFKFGIHQAKVNLLETKLRSPMKHSLKRTLKREKIRLTCAWRRKKPLPPTRKPPPPPVLSQSKTTTATSPQVSNKIVPNMALHDEPKFSQPVGGVEVPAPVSLPLSVTLPAPIAHKELQFGLEIMNDKLPISTTPPAGKFFQFLFLVFHKVTHCLYSRLEDTLVKLLSQVANSSDSDLESDPNAESDDDSVGSSIAYSSFVDLSEVEENEIVTETPLLRFQVLRPQLIMSPPGIMQASPLPHTEVPFWSPLPASIAYPTSVIDEDEEEEESDPILPPVFNISLEQILHKTKSNSTQSTPKLIPAVPAPLIPAAPPSKPLRKWAKKYQQQKKSLLRKKPNTIKRSRAASVNSIAEAVSRMFRSRS